MESIEAVNIGGMKSGAGFRWILRRCALLALVILLGVPATASAGLAGDQFPLQFDSEWIRLYVIGDSLEVRGTYVLRCQRRTARPYVLFYPFPQDSLLGEARIVSLRAKLDGIDAGEQSWKPGTRTAGVQWLTPACTGDTISMDVVYRQKLLTSYARYIVTTTREWGRPIRHARFDIHLPAGSVPVEFSFPFEARGDSLERYYRFDVDAFYPDRDVVVRWSR